MLNFHQSHSERLPALINRIAASLRCVAVMRMSQFKTFTPHGRRLPSARGNQQRRRSDLGRKYQKPSKTANLNKEKSNEYEYDTFMALLCARRQAVSAKHNHLNTSVCTLTQILVAAQHGAYEQLSLLFALLVMDKL